MTVRELVELNQQIVDIEIEIRKNGLLMDVLELGPSKGRIPPFPRKVPESVNYAQNPTRVKQATYIEKSINAWDDGKDYWQVKPDRIPKAWQELEVYSWGVWPASYVGVYRRACPSGHGKNVNFNGQRINIIALPSGESMAVPDPKQEEHDDQLNLFDYMGATT